MKLSTLLVSSLLTWSASPCGAALTETGASVAEDARFLQGGEHAEQQLGYSVHHITLAGGTEVREFVANNTVFGVAWSGPLKPDLRKILGPHFNTLVFEASRHPLAGHSQLHAVRTDLVLDSTGHARYYAGRAFVPALVPPGVAAATVVH